MVLWGICSKKRGIQKLSQDHVAVVNHQFGQYKNRLKLWSLVFRIYAVVSIVYCAWLLYCRDLPQVFVSSSGLKRSIFQGVLIAPLPGYLVVSLILTIWEHCSWRGLAKKFQPQATTLPEGLPSEFKVGTS